MRAATVLDPWQAGLVGWAEQEGRKGAGPIELLLRFYTKRGFFPLSEGRDCSISSVDKFPSEGVHGHLLSNAAGEPTGDRDVAEHPREYSQRMVLQAA